MSRSGYSDDYGDSNWDLICWRGAVASAIRGRRGQRFLHEMLAALDALESKTLVAEELQTYDGGVCAIGAWGAAKGINMMEMDPDDYVAVADVCGVARALVQEVVFMNDDGYYGRDTPEKRFQRMREWVKAQIVDGAPSPR